MPSEHYTAWLTTDTTCLEGPYCDITVLRDVQLGDDNDPNGWSSTGDPLLYEETTVLATEDGSYGAMAAAETLLLRNGWGLVSGWRDVPTGYVATVTRTTDRGEL